MMMIHMCIYIYDGLFRAYIRSAFGFEKTVSPKTETRSRCTPGVVYHIFPSVNQQFNTVTYIDLRSVAQQVLHSFG